MEGKVCDVLVEGPAKHGSAASGDGADGKRTAVLCGRTDGFKLVDFPVTAAAGDDAEDHIGRIVKVRITEGKTFSLRGELI